MKIKMTSAFRKDKKRCKKRHYDVDFLDKLIASYAANRGFSKEDAEAYYDYPLSGIWKGHRSFHPYGHNDDWIVIYHIEGDTIVLDSTNDESSIVLDRTGTHSDVYGSNTSI